MGTDYQHGTGKSDNVSNGTGKCTLVDNPTAIGSEELEVLKDIARSLKTLADRFGCGGGGHTYTPAIPYNRDRSGPGGSGTTAPKPYVTIIGGAGGEGGCGSGLDSGAGGGIDSGVGGNKIPTRLRGELEFRYGISPQLDIEYLKKLAYEMIDKGEDLRGYPPGGLNGAHMCCFTLNGAHFCTNGSYTWRLPY